jgi:hypothetical protein
VSQVNNGQYLLVEEGAYDGHCALGIFVATQDFDIKEVFEAYKKDIPDRGVNQHDTGQFLDFLILNNYIFCVEHDTLYLGGYELNPKLIRKTHA